MRKFKHKNNFKLLFYSDIFFKVSKRLIINLLGLDFSAFVLIIIDFFSALRHLRQFL